jgi:hypothetical protein
MAFSCTVQDVKVRFQNPPSATLNLAKYYDIFLRKNAANTLSTCRITSTETDCTMLLTTSVTALTDLVNWDIVPNQVGAQPQGAGIVSITGVCK